MDGVPYYTSNEKLGAVSKLEQAQTNLKDAKQYYENINNKWVAYGNIECNDSICKKCHKVIYKIREDLYERLMDQQKIIKEYENEIRLLTIEEEVKNLKKDV